MHKIDLYTNTYGDTLHYIESYVEIGKKVCFLTLFLVVSADWVKVDRLVLRGQSPWAIPA